jgi:hypothetical protein
LALAFGACAADTSVDTEETTALSALPESDSVTTTTTAATTTTAPPIVTTTTSTTLLAGGPIDFGPRGGDVLAVIGVAHDDTLNLRAAPGPTQEILDTVNPVYESLVAAGETWELPGAFWVKVGYEGTPGWVHMGFVAYLGQTDDVTARVTADLGESPVTNTMEELGLLVAETFVSPEPSSEIVMTVGPTPDDFAEVTYDVIGLGDDAVTGVRLHVFGAPADGGFTLASVESTDLCARGVTEEGPCV